MTTTRLWRRVARDRWIYPATPLALVYSDCNFTLYSGGAPICDLQSLEEAHEALADLLDHDSTLARSAYETRF
jgi:hypothetical protein